MITPAVRHTHQIRRDGDLVIKTYRSWDRGEAEREWSALRRIADHQPGLAPRPIRADLAGSPPSITMGVVAGEPILGRWTDRQLDGLATALDRLWSVPVAGLQPIAVHWPAYWQTLMTESMPPAAGEERLAYQRVCEWVDRGGVGSVLRDRGPAVLGQGDPQLGNLLYDGTTVRLVDFEDAGPSDRELELGNFAEHLGTRGSCVGRVADRFDVDHDRLHAARLLWATFWLFKLSPDPAGRRPDRSDELRDQARRVLRLLDGDDPADAAGAG
jgi:hypothetical protein